MLSWLWLSGGALLVAVLVCRYQLRALVRPLLNALMAAAGTFLIIGGPMLVFQFFGPQRVTGTIQPFNVYVTDLANLVIPTDRTWVRPVDLSASQMAAWSGNGAEQTGYVGLPLLAVSLYAVIRWWRSPMVRITAGVTIVLEVLSLGPHLHVGGHDTLLRLPGVAFSHLPLLEHVLPGRLSLMAAFGFAFFMAIALDRTLFRVPRRAIGGSLLGVLSIVSWLPPPPFPAVSTTIPAYFTSRDGARSLPIGTVALVAPYIDNGVDDAVAMLWQAEADFRFSLTDGLAIIPDAAGHGVFEPASPLRDAFHQIQADGIAPLETLQVRKQLNRALGADRVTAVIVGPMAHREIALSFMAWLLGAQPVATEGVSIWRLDARAS